MCATVQYAWGKSKEWTTSALLGQHQMDEAEAAEVGKMLDLPEAGAYTRPTFG
jgi:cyanate lyase